MHRLLALAATLSIHAVRGLHLEQKVLEPLEAFDPYDIRHELIKAEIIPTVMDDFLPDLYLAAEWSSKAYASLGNTLKPSKLQDAPTVSLNLTESTYACKSNVTYVITLTDPDAPSRDNPKWSEMCHWIAVGAASSWPSDQQDYACSSSSMLLSLADVMPYKAPGPPEKTGKHRYVFLAFVPANGTTEKLNLSKPDSRQHWGTGKERHGVRDWARDHGLAPVAANFMYSQHKKQ